ncbi:VOC family protein [Nocardia brasiliensis]|uniref:VOC family protein n=1 Tax=Nocardia brasiliensis TaxID=37326 RepID=UPI003D914D36
MSDRAAFDHLIHWVDDLDGAMRAYDACGLTTQGALTMPGFRNAAWGVDDERYVELATVDDWAAVGTSKYAAGLEVLKPAIEALPGPGLLTFAVDVVDAHATAARFRAAGREVDVVEVRFEEENVGFVEVFVRDAPAYFPFFITYAPPRHEIGRMRAEPRAAAGISSAGRPDLVALLIGSADPEGEARVFAEFVGCPARDSVVELPGAEVRFAEGFASGLSGIAVRGASVARGANIAGMTVIGEQ